MTAHRELVEALAAEVDVVLKEFSAELQRRWDHEPGERDDEGEEFIARIRSVFAAALGETPTVQVGQSPQSDIPSGPPRTSAPLPAGYVMGLDGKVYPSRNKRSERLYVIQLVHVLAHSGLTHRQVVVALADRHNIRRSVGSVNADLTNWQCPTCSGDPDETPEQPKTTPSGDAA